MGGYRCILLAVDFTAAAEAAARRAAALAHDGSARLHLLHVLEHFPEDLPVGTIVPEDVDPKGRLLAQAEARLAALAERTGCTGSERQVIATSGSARHAIVERAGTLGSDLVIVGAERNTGWGAGLGSTGGSLVHHAPCDVLVVRPR